MKCLLSRTCIVFFYTSINNIIPNNIVGWTKEDTKKQSTKVFALKN